MNANTWVHDFGKFKMVLSKNDVDISSQIKKFGWYEDEKFETEIFEKNLKNGMTVLDLGANIGFYSLLARSIVGENGKIFSFEPFPENIALLRQSIIENNFTNIVANEYAISDKSGQSVLYLSPDACSEHSMLDLDFDNKKHEQKKISVKVNSVDDYFAVNNFDKKIDFIKMDIEGSESRALEGLKKTLDVNPQISIMTEFWPNGFRKDGKSPEKFLSRLINLDFEIYHIDACNHKLLQRSPDEIVQIEKNSKQLIEQNEVMRKWGWYTNLLCIRK